MCPRPDYALVWASRVRQAQERLATATTPQQSEAVQRALEDLLAQVEDRVILAYERGHREMEMLHALGEVLAYALEMLVEGDRAKAQRALERAAHMLASPHRPTSPRKEGRPHATSTGGLPRH
ncbi:MAG: hypothetical protein NZ951_04070 [Dehalococcoidia bacterium]|nr:hypothetical protein [Dehalococcoidia bacterium]MDW8120515.1 hypothetical protein [Chloroflexota bacterium]